jgi:hypothetical protein
MTLFDVVTAVIEVTEDEREVVPVLVHLIESGRVRRPCEAELHPTGEVSEPR